MLGRRADPAAVLSVIDARSRFETPLGTPDWRVLRVASTMHEKLPCESNSTEVQDDLERAGEIARQMVCHCGMSDTIAGDLLTHETLQRSELERIVLRTTTKAPNGSDIDGASAAL